MDERRLEEPLLGPPNAESDKGDNAVLADMRRDGQVQGPVMRRRLPSIKVPLEELERKLKKQRVEHKKEESLVDTLLLAYSSIGVVFGDLGTSCLYTMSGIFAGFKSQPVHDDVLGAVCLIFWTLTLIAVVKYVLIVLRADDNGEGGTFALYSLLCRHANLSLVGAPATSRQRSHLSRYNVSSPPSQHLPVRRLSARSQTRSVLEHNNKMRRALLLVVLLATSMVLGDGVLTPAISVLAAVQGVQLTGYNFSTHTVLLATVIILLALFYFQRYGTTKVGFIFAPITLAWLIANTGIGIYNICKYNPGVLSAINPLHAIMFFIRNGRQSWSGLCGVILCVTGAEAMYADIGHFSRRSIQVAFLAVIYPCLLVTYFGQAAYFSQFPHHVHDGFWKSIPKSIFWPLLALATAASVVASQALISGAFSLVKQSMTLRCFPQVKVVHTSNSLAGQIYIPEVNYLLCGLTIAVVLLFQDSEKLGNAYGLAVASVMLLTTCLTTLVSLVVWEAGLFKSLAFLLFFGVIEFAFFAACIPEIPEGAWFPLALAVVFLCVMYAWHYGSARKVHYDNTHRVQLEQLKSLNTQLEIVRVPGLALYYTETADGVPPVLSHAITTLHALHQCVVFVTVQFEPVPSLESDDRFEVQKGEIDGIYRCILHYGYQEDVDHGEHFVDELIARIDQHLRRRAKEQISEENENPSGSREVLEEAEEEVDRLWQAKDDGVVYVLGREEVNPKQGSSWAKRTMLSAYFYLKNISYRTDAMFNIPHSRLLEVGMMYDV